MYIIAFLKYEKLGKNLDWLGKPSEFRRGRGQIIFRFFIFLVSIGFAIFFSCLILKPEISWEFGHALSSWGYTTYPPLGWVLGSGSPVFFLLMALLFPVGRKKPFFSLLVGFPQQNYPCLPGWNLECLSTFCAFAFSCSSFLQTS